MTEITSLDYYSRRERQARELAEKALLQPIKTIHLDMAARYAELAQAANGNAGLRPTLSICS